MSAVVMEAVVALERRGGGLAHRVALQLKLKSLIGGSIMSGCAVSNRLIRNRSLFCLSMLFLAATLALVPAAEAQDTPSFDEATVANQKYEAGVAIEALELPAAAGGSGDLTYALSPLPLGLEFDAGSRTLSGTPSEVAISLMTYEVTDADGDTATLTFEIEVDTMPSFDGATVADQSYQTGEDIGVLGLPVASSGDGPLVYSLSPAVPGLTFDAGSWTLSGTPTVAGTYEMTYRVEDSDTNMEESDAEELTFTVSVELTFAAVAARQTTFTAGEEIKQPWELPVGRSTDALTYSLIGECCHLPGKGLLLDGLRSDGCRWCYGHVDIQYFSRGGGCSSEL
jgi:hypothetical protein